MFFQKEFETKTGGRLDALDITTDVEELVRECGVTDGSVLIFSPHTTCSVLVAHGWREVAESMGRLMAEVAPEDAYYAHDDLDIRTENLVDDEPANAPAHIMHVFVGRTSETVPVIDGRLALGDGQRLLFVELDSSRKRRYLVQVLSG